MDIIRIHLSLIVWCITSSKDDTIVRWCRKVWLLFWLYALNADISQANIVERFVNNSQAKRWYVNALELFKTALESGEFYLLGKLRGRHKSQILIITQFCIIFIDMKDHEYLNMCELICIQTETVQVRKNAKDIKYWRRWHLCYRDYLLCDVYEGDRKKARERG